MSEQLGGKIESKDSDEKQKSFEESSFEVD
jgi:hypothetical protein